MLLVGSDSSKPSVSLLYVTLEYPRLNMSGPVPINPIEDETPTSSLPLLVCAIRNVKLRIQSKVINKNNYTA